MKNYKQIYKRQSGFTLVELAIVLGIVGLVVFFALRGSGDSEEKLKIQQEMQTMAQIGKGCDDYFATRIDTTGANNTVLQQCAPSSKNVGGAVKNEFGGTMTLATDTVTTAGDAYTLTSPNYTNNACLKVVPKLQQNFTVIKVNGTIVKAQTDTAIQDASLQTACAAGNTNSIAYTNRKL